MKHLVLLFIIITIFTTNISQGQITFGVSPGIKLNNAYFGYKINSFVPYASFQYMLSSTKASVENSVYDDDGNLVKLSDVSDIETQLIIPSIGVKMFFAERGKINAYGNIMVSKPIVNIEQTEENSYENVTDDLLKDLNIWAGEIGIGTEYFFDNNFSVGGEFGFRYINANHKETVKDEIYNPNTNKYEFVDMTEKLEVKFSPTYAKIWLNFYFGKEE